MLLDRFKTELYRPALILWYDNVKNKVLVSFLFENLVIIQMDISRK